MSARAGRTLTIVGGGLVGATTAAIAAHVLAWPYPIGIVLAAFMLGMILSR